MNLGNKLKEVQDLVSKKRLELNNLIKKEEEICSLIINDHFNIPDDKSFLIDFGLYIDNISYQHKEDEESITIRIKKHRDCHFKENIILVLD